MRLQTEGTILEGAKLVFLDTADWSDMEQGRSPAATELRALCAAGRARILVTGDHLLEVGGLTSGRESRIAFMQTFPGAVLLEVGGSQMLRLAAGAFAMGAFDGELRPQALSFRELQQTSFQDISEMIQKTRLLRGAHGLYASAIASSRAAERKVTREERELNEKLHRLARKGDVTKVLEYLRQRRRLGGWKGAVHQLSARARVLFYRWANKRGLFSSSSGDILFDELVTSALPQKVASDPQLMEPLFKVWSDPETFAVCAPSIACVAAIARQSGQTKDLQKIRSTMIDQWHAAFAPMVDVFTCDRRVHPIVARTLRVARPQTAVLRCAALDAVVDVLKAP